MSRHRAPACAPRHARSRTSALAALVDLTTALTERIEALEHSLDWERRRWDARHADGGISAGISAGRPSEVAA